MITIQKITSAKLAVGMYVSSLDRPWVETPFPLQGFKIQTGAQLEKLRLYCQFVYIDCTKGVSAVRSTGNLSGTGSRMPLEDMFADRTLKTYPKKSKWTEEYDLAQDIVSSLNVDIDLAFQKVASGGSLDVIKIKKSIEPMISSIVRNPEAFNWLAKMKKKDEYTYHHSLAVAIWAVSLGRQIGLPKADLRSLALGALLFDIGKLHIDSKILKVDRALNTSEFAEMKTHVKLGLDILQESGIINQSVIDMVAYHHERFNGSGYPNGLKGDRIPIFARIAAIVDSYDAMTSLRSYAPAISPSVAIKKLYEMRDVYFQAELVEEFIQAVGIYPAGTLVELSTGEIAVVVAEYHLRRLRPKVLVLLDKNRQPLAARKLIDMKDQEEAEDGSPLSIVRSLEAEAYGIDINDIDIEV